jgi:hypothetical protein
MHKQAQAPVATFAVRPNGEGGPPPLYVPGTNGIERCWRDLKMRRQILKLRGQSQR